MKITAILGSPHGDRGATGTLLTAVLEGAAAQGAQVSTIALGSRQVRPCVGCDVCHKTGTCAVRDDFGAIRQTLLESDGIVLASPNYIFSVSAQLKALMDRCCGPIHTQAFRGHYGAAVVTSGGDGSAEVETYTLRFLAAVGCWTVGSVGASAAQVYNPARLPERQQAARDLGRKLVEAIRAKQTFPEQEPQLRAFGHWMRGLCTSQKDRWPFEYEYWQQQPS